MSPQKSTNVHLLSSLFATLEQHSPTLGGRLANQLWFRLPARPSAAERDRRTPAGGEPFEVAVGEHGTVRGRVYGDWGRPTAYLVHGWGGWWQQLAAFVQPLVDEGLCVVAFDAPGHGGSDRGRDGRRTTTFLEMAAALAAVEREFGRPTVVVAHSAGALATMVAMTDHDPVQGRSPLPHPAALVLVAVPATIDAMVSTFVHALGIGPRSTAVMRTHVERRIGRRMGEFDLLALASAHARLPRLLLVHDEDDPEAPFSGALDVANAWHASRLVVTRGLGHRRPLWDPETVKRVTEFAASAADGIRAESARASRA